jgi:hypothetical protein
MKKYSDVLGFSQMCSDLLRLGPDLEEAFGASLEDEGRGEAISTFILLRTVWRGPAGGCDHHNSIQ